MPGWSPEAIDRLFALYQRHLAALKRDRDVAAIDRDFGSLEPHQSDLSDLTRSEFEALLVDPRRDQEIVNLWVQRIVRGHEEDFPMLQAAG